MRRMTFIVVLLLAGTAQAQTNRPRMNQGIDWIADATTRCRIWNAEPQANESVTWSGTCRNGYAHGPGVLQWHENQVATERFDGNMERGRPHGHGTYAWPDGSRYEGDFRDGFRTGRGVQTWTDGARYEGEYRSGNFSGRGAYTWADGSRYEGDFRRGKMSGWGVFTTKAGDRYEGEFADDRPNGFGTYKEADGSTYAGLWTNGCFRQSHGVAAVMATEKECSFGVRGRPY